MKLTDAIGRLRQETHFVAVYEELADFLSKAVEGDHQIPTDTDEDVDPDVVEAVLEFLLMTRDEHQKRIEKLESMEVADGSSHRRRGGGR